MDAQREDSNSLDSPRKARTLLLIEGVTITEVEGDERVQLARGRMTLCKMATRPEELRELQSAVQVTDIAHESATSQVLFLIVGEHQVPIFQSVPCLHKEPGRYTFVMPDLCLELSLPVGIDKNDVEALEFLLRQYSSLKEVKSALSKPCKKKPRSRPSGELWRLDEENVGYSPACQEEGLDAVVDLLDALEGRSASRQKQLQERLRKLHDDGRSRQLRLQEENRRLDERRPGKKMTEKQAKAAVARLVQRKRPTGSEAEGEVKQPPPPDKPAKPRVVINKEKQKALVARLYTTDLEKRGIRENQRAEQRRELELEELRTEYPVRSKEEIKAQCNAWSAKGSMQLADKTRLGIEEKELLLKQKHKHNSFTSADSVVREDILSLLVSPKATMDGDPEPLLNCQKYMENPCVDLGAPWVATSRKSAARRAEEADRCFFTPNEKAPGEYIPARDPGWVPPHAHWSTEGARKLVDRTAKEIKTRMDRRKWLDSGYRDPNVETPDTKQRAALLGNLIHPVSNEGLFPHQHPYINQYDWLPNSPAVERELESDRAFLSANDEY